MEGLQIANRAQEIVIRPQAVVGPQAGAEMTHRLGTHGSCSSSYQILFYLFKDVQAMPLPPFTGPEDKCFMFLHTFK